MRWPKGRADGRRWKCLMSALRQRPCGNLPQQLRWPRWGCEAVTRTSHCRGNPVGPMMRLDLPLMNLGLPLMSLGLPLSLTGG